MTGLEIIDTAVKIGLGGMISGIATFLVTRKSHHHELEKLARADKKELIREISIMLEEGTSNLNRGIHQYGIEDSPENLALILESKNLINKAKALTTMSGEDELFEEIQNYSESITKLYTALNYGNGNYDEKECNKIIKEINMHWVNIYPLLSSAYNNIWSNV